MHANPTLTYLLAFREAIYTALEMTHTMPTNFEVFFKMLKNSFDEKQHTLVIHHLDRIKDELQQISKGIEELKEKA